MDIDDGSDKPLGYTTEDSELEVRRGADGTIGYHETELGQHQRWLRQAPDLYEKYQEALIALQRMEVKELSRADPRATGEGARDEREEDAAWESRQKDAAPVAVSLDPHRLLPEIETLIADAYSFATQASEAHTRGYFQEIGSRLKQLAARLRGEAAVRVEDQQR